MNFFIVTLVIYSVVVTMVLLWVYRHYNKERLNTAHLMSNTDKRIELLIGVLLYQNNRIRELTRDKTRQDSQFSKALEDLKTLLQE